MTLDGCGGCLCGAVRFTTTGALRGVIYCHCGQCRRQTGHFCAATSIPDTGLTVDGVDNVAWYRSSPSARRGFCRNCGSTLFWKPDGEARTSIMAGTFDTPTGLVGLGHLHRSEKSDYYEVADGLPDLDD